MGSHNWWVMVAALRGGEILLGVCGQGGRPGAGTALGVEQRRDQRAAGRGRAASSPAPRSAGFQPSPFGGEGGVLRLQPARAAGVPLGHSVPKPRLPGRRGLGHGSSQTLLLWTREVPTSRSPALAPCSREARVVRDHQPLKQPNENSDDFTFK